MSSKVVILLDINGTFNNMNSYRLEEVGMKTFIVGYHGYHDLLTKVRIDTQNATKYSNMRHF